MRIGISTGLWDVRGYGRWGQDTYQKVREHGWDAVDFDMSNTDSELYTAPPAQADALLEREKRLAAEAGVEIFQAHGPWRWPPQDETAQDRAERMEKMQRSIRAAAVLGCKNWVVHPIMPFGVCEREDAAAAEKTWQMNLEFMDRLLQTAREYDVTICLENMPMLDFSMAKPEAVLRFVRSFADSRLQICLDTGHVAVFRELSLADSVRQLGSAIRVLHVHDNAHSMDLHLMPYTGIVDWPAFSRALHDIGYAGVLSLETLPFRALPDELFCEMCRQLARVADHIANHAFETA